MGAHGGGRSVAGGLLEALHGVDDLLHEQTVVHGGELAIVQLEQLLNRRVLSVALELSVVQLAHRNDLRVRVLPEDVGEGDFAACVLTLMVTLVAKINRKGELSGVLVCVEHEVDQERIERCHDGPKAIFVFRTEKLVALEGEPDLLELRAHLIEQGLGSFEGVVGVDGLGHQCLQVKVRLVRITKKALSVNNHRVKKEAHRMVCTTSGSAYRAERGKHALDVGQSAFKIGRGLVSHSKTLECPEPWIERVLAHRFVIFPLR